MEPSLVFAVGIVTGTLLLSLWMIVSGGKRSAKDVLTGLGAEESNDFVTSPSLALGFEGDREKRFYLFERLFPCLGIAISVTAGTLIRGSSLSTVLLFTVIGVAAGYLVARRLRALHSMRTSRRIYFMLPLVMERLVMGVLAGFDVLSSVNRVVKLEERTRASRDLKDPVTGLLAEAYELSVRGIPFEKALNQVCARIENPALRHAFMHLAQAHKEGGALIGPLRELSDSTQLYYQETVEEEIAKLPVHATVPLIVMFAGLLLLFATPPILQVMKLTTQAAAGF